MIRFRTRSLLLGIAAALAFARPALAGPPLLCFPFEIGAERSLPMRGGTWAEIDPTYNTARLVDDTLALLAPATPVIVRMETLRRAAVYAGKNPALAAPLLDRLRDRAAVADANAPLAVFDFGYLVETYKQGVYAFGAHMTAAHAVDGYALVEKAAAMTGDPTIEFTLAVMTRDKTRGAEAYRAHLDKVLKAAPQNPAIAANLRKQFGSDIEGTR